MWNRLDKGERPLTCFLGFRPKDFLHPRGVVLDRDLDAVEKRTPIEGAA